MNNEEYDNHISNEYENQPAENIENNESNENVENKQGSDYKKKVQRISNGNSLNSICIALYVFLIIGIFIQFVPICPGSWYSIGMGKLLIFAAIIGIFSIIRKNYFVAFFISLFASFFVFHEVIIFYDNYAIELGRELNPDGIFRSVIEVYKDAFSVKYGAFWSLLGSVFSLIFVSIAWISNIVKDNLNFAKRNQDEKAIV